MEILTSVEFWIAVVGSGGLLRLIEYVINRFLNAKGESVRIIELEKGSLRDDIDYWKVQVQELRVAVDQIQADLIKRDKELALWRGRYWDTRARLDRLVTHVRYNVSEESRAGSVSVLEELAQDTDLVE